MTEDLLYARVAQILDQARGQVARTVNTAMVQACWHIGREIVEVEQGGRERAGYGEEVIKKLAARLQGAFGKGFSAASLKRMRQFCLAFPNGSALDEKGSTVSSLSGASLHAFPYSSALSVERQPIRSALPSVSGDRPGPSRMTRVTP